MPLPHSQPHRRVRAWRFLAQAGFTARDSIAAIPDVLNLARASALGLGEAADIASNVMSGFGIAAGDAANVTDILAGVSSRANTDVRQLGEAAGYVGPVAAAMGISLEDAAAAIGVMSNAGIQGSRAGTSLRRLLASLANPTDAATEALNSLGIQMSEVSPESNSLSEIIGTLAEAGLSGAEAFEIFGNIGAPGILALVANNDELTALGTELDNVKW